MIKKGYPLRLENIVQQLPTTLFHYYFLQPVPAYRRQILA